MKKSLAAIGCLFVLWAILSIFPTVAQIPQFPQNLPPNTVVGRTGITAGPAQAIPFSQLLPLVAGSISPGSITPAMLASMPANTYLCNPTGTSASPQDCATPLINLSGVCNIDGNTFAATIAGIQAAIHTAGCYDIYIPAGTYTGSSLIIDRSNVRLHGAGGISTPQGISVGQIASTVLSFSCTSGAAVNVGNSNPPLSYGGIDISDLAILLPSACNMIGISINASTPDSGNMVRRVRVTELTGNTVGTAISLAQAIYSWRFEDVIVDHFNTGYLLNGQNHFTQIVGGQIRNNANGILNRNNLGVLNVNVQNVDIEGNTGFAIDIQSGEFFIYGNYIDNAAASNSIAIRIGNGASPVEGVTIIGNHFNGISATTANYAIDLESPGFVSLVIIGNHFNAYGTANILNNAAAATSSRGTILSNDWFGTQAYATAWTGIITNDAATNRNFFVSQLPTCNFLMQGAVYFVDDQNTATAWHGAVTGGGSNIQGVYCTGTAWLQQ